MSAAMENSPQNDKSFFGHPRGLSTLFFTEMWERFSYYGMRAILMLYMTAAVETGGLGWTPKVAGPIYALYASSVYFLPLIGGWIADRFIGAKRATFVGGVIIMCGHFTLAFNSITTFYIGLILVAVGTGFLKSNISTMVGDLYSKEDIRRDAGFSIFYMGINLGATISPLICGFLAQDPSFRSWIAKFGFEPGSAWHFGFAMAGIGMFFGLIQYLLGRKNLQGVGDVPVDTRATGAPKIEISPLYIFQMVGLIILSTAVITYFVLTVDFDFALTFVLMPVVLVAGLLGVLFTGMQDRLSIDEWKRLGVIIVLFAFSTVFWMGYEQAATSFNLFADQLTDLRVFNGWAFPASWLQSVNGAFIVILAPVAGLVWLKLGKRQPSDSVKFSIALFLGGLAYVIMAYASSLTSFGKVSFLWLFLVYFFQTAGELCLSPVGLSSMTKLAPRKMVSLMMGIWFLSISMGNFAAGIIGGEFQPSADVLVSIFTKVAITLIGGAAVLFVISPLVKKLYSLPATESIPVEPA